MKIITPHGIFPAMKNDSSDRNRAVKARRRATYILARNHPDKLQEIMDQFDISASEARRLIGKAYPQEALELYKHYYEQMTDEGVVDGGVWKDPLAPEGVGAPIIRSSGTAVQVGTRPSMYSAVAADIADTAREPVVESAYTDIFGESKAGRPVGAGSYFNHRGKERKVSEKAVRRAEAVLRRRHEDELVRLFEAEYEYLMNVEED